MGDLKRHLGTRDAVIIGLGSMIGAGIFSAMGPAAQAAGGWLLAGLAVAALVAYCNATSTARLAAVHPASGGTYVYGTRQLGPFWGYLAGWCFIIGKIASCAAMALTVGAYAWPGLERPIAIGVVVALVALNCFGVQKSAILTRVVVAVVLASLAAFVVSGWVGSGSAGQEAGDGGGVLGIFQAAGLLFFAFAGYARIATLGEEVRDPERTIPRAIPVALFITLGVYAAVALTLLHVLGAGGIAESGAPVLDAARASEVGGWLPIVVQVAAVAAAAGSLLGLILGASRTTLAMARDSHLPKPLANVSDGHGAPWVAEITVGVFVIVLVLLFDLRGAIGFSSFGVLIYYAVANVAARTLTPEQGRPPAWVPLVGLAGCVVLVATLPLGSVVSGAIVVLLGMLAYALRRRRSEEPVTA
ncbi:MAG: APC family permease [Mobilicoccus sp.]|nr:APC family permease [Mobilicoccus sp.]